MQIDVRGFPLIHIRLGDTITDAEIANAFRTVDECAQRALANKMHYAVLVEGSGGFTPTQRRAIATELSRATQSYSPWSLGSFVVVSSGAVRGAVTAIQWLAPQLANLHVYPDRAAALEAARTALAEHQARSMASNA